MVNKVSDEEEFHIFKISFEKTKFFMTELDIAFWKFFLNFPHKSFSRKKFWEFEIEKVKRETETFGNYYGVSLDSPSSTCPWHILAKNFLCKNLSNCKHFLYKTFTFFLARTCSWRTAQEQKFWIFRNLQTNPLWTSLKQIFSAMILNLLILKNRCNEWLGISVKTYWEPH